MVTDEGNLKLVDFGTAKLFKVTELNDKSGQTIKKSKSEFKADFRRAYSIDSVDSNSKSKESFVGTALYASPELINKNYASYEADLWAIGVILYRMSTGNQPFYDRNDYLVFQKISKVDYRIPKVSNFVLIQTISMLMKILQI